MSRREPSVSRGNERRVTSRAAAITVTLPRITQADGHVYDIQGGLIERAPVASWEINLMRMPVRLPRNVGWMQIGKKLANHRASALLLKHLVGSTRLLGASALFYVFVLCQYGSVMAKGYWFDMAQPQCKIVFNDDGTIDFRNCTNWQFVAGQHWDASGKHLGNYIRSDGVSCGDIETYIGNRLQMDFSYDSDMFNTHLNGNACKSFTLQRQ